MQRTWQRQMASQTAFDGHLQHRAGSSSVVAVEGIANPILLQYRLGRLSYISKAGCFFILPHSEFPS